MESDLYTLQPYAPEPWMASICKEQLPTTRVALARLPTPITPLRPFSSPLVDAEALAGVEIHLKRDDLTSFDLGGNKVRKLEFLLADALQRGFDSVITIGGLQSNHCRATALAARQVGLTPILILRTELSEEQIDVEGNLMLSRMVGAKIYTVKPEDYYEKGGDFFVHQLAQRLAETQGRKCYEVPCGGSNTLGTFGYLHAVAELIRQAGIDSCAPESAPDQDCEGGKRDFPYDHLVFGCGSGGTAAGLAIGVHLARLDVKVHAVGVCDSPDEFYEVVRHKAESLGLTGQKQEGFVGDFGAPPLHNDVRRWLSIHDAQGLGYSLSSPEELQFLYDVSSQTGMVLDPVYSGKALFKLCTDLVKSQPEVFRPGHRVLFVHTGGALGNYAKGDQLLTLMRADAQSLIEPL